MSRNVATRVYAACHASFRGVTIHLSPYRQLSTCKFRFSLSTGLVLEPTAQARLTAPLELALAERAGSVWLLMDLLSTRADHSIGLRCGFEEGRARCLKQFQSRVVVVKLVILDMAEYRWRYVVQP
nr:hypothetical protein CFP56_78459 [Quercus suber]